MANNYCTSTDGWLVLGLILFLPAGSLTWTKGWLFLIVSVAAIIAAVVYLRRVNPEIFVARSRIHKGTKLWDKILLCFLLPAFFAVLVIAALDDGRFKWSDLPRWAVGVGYALFATGFMLTVWAQAVNRFFDSNTGMEIRRAWISGPVCARDFAGCLRLACRTG